jgi:hypothetical protein
MSLRHKRRLTLAGIFVAAAFFIWIGLDGWTIQSLPAHYLGFIVATVGLAGALGLNIWHGGPLDLRLDRSESEQ